MLPVQHIGLKHIETLICKHGTKVEIHQHESGKLALSATLDQPGGVAYFGVKQPVLNDFFDGKITLQELFDNSPSVFIEICDQGETKLYIRYDIDIHLKDGSKTYYDLQPDF